MASIEVLNVSKRYKRRRRMKAGETLKSFLLQSWFAPRVNDGPEYIHALQNVTIRVPQGKMIGIIGSNGSGKSTLLKLLAGIGRPNSGSINISGRVSALIELGAGFHPEISGRENVFINGALLGLTSKEVAERFDAIVAFAELEDFIDQPVKTYSSGMYMRLGFSVAVHVDPQVLLIDEVLAVGDEHFVHKCVQRIEDFKNEGKTIVLVTHNLDFVARMCDIAVWLEKGKIRSEGLPRRVVDAYLRQVTDQENIQIQASRESSPPPPAVELEPLVVAEPTSEPEVSVTTEDSEPRSERWGSKEIEIHKVCLIDAKGDERAVFQTGDSMAIRMEFEAHAALEDVVFGIGLFTISGTLAYGTNTDIERIPLVVKVGKGSVTFEVPVCDILEGRYFLDVATHSVEGRPYDYQRRVLVVTFHNRLKDQGIYRPKHSWNFQGAVSIDSSQRTTHNEL